MNGGLKGSLVLCTILFTTLGSDASEPSRIIPLWPGGVAPGDQPIAGEEHDTTKPTDNLIAGKPVIRLGNVSKPTIGVFAAAANKTGTAVLVCPGGGYHILAMDLEGTEVCDWLNSIGVTAFLLKYRVPARPGSASYASPLQDAQRALGLIRHNARDWQVDPTRIGVLGFSAGGHLAALLGSPGESRSYQEVDAADKTSCQPDFAILIYPGGLIHRGQSDKIGSEVLPTAKTPPTFLAMAQDDPVRVENVLFYAEELRKAKVPFELHVYPSGGHGYGLRPSKDSVTTWPARAADWMRAGGWLGK